MKKTILNISAGILIWSGISFIAVQSFTILKSALFTDQSNISCIIQFLLGVLMLSMFLVCTYLVGKSALEYKESNNDEDDKK
jgi:hypothetical protein